MFEYTYRAFGENGNMLSGVITAKSGEQATSLLVKRGYTPVEIKKGRAVDTPSASGRLSDIFQTVQPRILILFTKQFQTMIRAGVNLSELLPILKEQTENPKLKNIIGQIAQDIQGGIRIHEAFRKHPATFSPLYCSVIQAGEQSDQLAEVLGRLIYIIEHEYRMTSDIRAALRYPFIVLIFLGIAFFIMMSFVIPKFITIFEARKVALPLATRICVHIHNAFVDYGIIIWIALLGGFLALVLWLRTDAGRYFRDYIVLHIPVMGTLFIKSIMSRFASIFAILHGSGVPMLEAMTILSETIGNRVVSGEFRNIRRNIEGGGGIAGPLKASRFFTPMVVNMVAIGEKTEKLESMLEDVSRHYDSEVEYAMQSLTDALAPVLTVGMAVVVGFFALAIFLPIWDMARISLK